MSPPLVPCPDIRRKALWREFLCQPGTLESLLANLETAKKVETGGLPTDEADLLESQIVTREKGRESACPAIRLKKEIDVPGPDDEFQPLSESSRLPPPTSPCRSPLPPMSPRTVSPRLSEQSSSPRHFYLERNIDQVPERNVTSPRADKEDLVAIKVPVIKQTPSKNQCEVKRESPAIEAKKPEIGVGSIGKKNILEVPPSKSVQRKTPDIISPFYPPLLSVPVLPPSFVCEVQRFFSTLPGCKVTPLTSGGLAILLDLPQAIRRPLFHTVFGRTSESGSCSQFLSFWQAKAQLLHSAGSTERVFHLLTGCSDSRHIRPEHLEPLVRDVLASHPGLAFFSGRTDCKDLQDCYVQSVVASIMFHAGGWCRKRINYRQFCKINLLDIIDKVSQPEEHDLNLLEHFSYDQFYVFYHQFVSRDPGERGFLTRRELLEAEDSLGMFTSQVVDRVFLRNVTGPVMYFEDWVYFLMAEVDKGCPSGTDYWFSVLDTDDDGLLSLTELESFYCASLVLLTTADMAVPQMVSWEDLATQIVDTTAMVKQQQFSSMDLKRNAKFPHILDAFINIFRFIVDDESEVVEKSHMTPIQVFVIKSIIEMENEE